MLGTLTASEEDAARQIYAHLKIHDARAAADVAKTLMKSYPESNEVRLAYIQALAEKGDEAAVFQEWNLKREEFQKDRHALEILAWSVLKKGELSPQVQIHLCSLIGASITRDVRAIPMLVSGLRSSSAFLRLLSVRFAAQLGDGSLQEELSRLIDEERVWFVKQEVIEAIGQLRIMALRPQLVKIVASPKTLAEEKVKAILALVRMYDGVRTDDLVALLNSKRSGLRQLGCELIAYFDLHGDTPKLFKLLKDSSPDVRGNALSTLGLLQVKIGGEQLTALMEDSYPEVAITAAWVACRQGNADGAAKLKTWLSDIHPRWRWMAASMLPRCGSIAHDVIKEQLDTHEDPFVKANLALGLVGQRVEVEKASQVIDEFFRDPETGPLMWDGQTIVPNIVHHIEQVQNYPTIVDQLTRLDLLNLLCILKYPKAQETIKEYVKNATVGVTGAAVSVLLQEGDEEAMKIIRELLKESDSHIRVQAALMLALYGNDPSALKVLREEYVHVNRDTKIQILEAIGHVGTQESIPFLVDILGEPFQLMRVVAASAIIQCLYH
ncbi:MAG: HEAT repeat domain-containing protein [Rhabdochlamydiaceae bacterium]